MPSICTPNLLGQLVNGSKLNTSPILIKPSKSS